jgi:hypothetical protein
MRKSCFVLLLAAACVSDPEVDDAQLLTVTSGHVRPHGASDDCAPVIAALPASVANVQCFVSADLTTANAATTPADNSISGLPAGAYTPRTDRENIPGVTPGARYPITKIVPGLQISGTFADQPMARWLIRLPAAWNGKLMVGVPAGARSEHALDVTHSDYAVQNGYAFAASNKGHYASRPSTAADPLACAVSPPGGTSENVFVRLYQADLPQDQAFAGWVKRTVETTRLAKGVSAANYGHRPNYTYVSGNSVGGSVTRKLMEKAKPSGRAKQHGHDHDDADDDDDDDDDDDSSGRDQFYKEFHGGLDWMPPYINSNDDYNGILSAFPSGLKNVPGYVASGFDKSGPSYAAIEAAHFPPDIIGAPSANSATGSFLQTHFNTPWHVLECSAVRIFDPTYAGLMADYNYPQRFQEAHMKPLVDALSTSGKLKRPLITIHGTMDATATLYGSRLYRQDVIHRGKAHLHRLYEVQNGTHRDKYREAPLSFPQIENMVPTFVEAFERLVAWVEFGQQPPAGQCVPRAGSIVDDPASAGRAEHCVNLLEP